MQSPRKTNSGYVDAASGEGREAPEYRFSAPEEAFKQARRRISNAVRRRQRSLDLSGFGITKLPPEIGELTNLLSLDLTGNQLDELPSAIGGLASLRQLSVGKNFLRSLPNEIGNLIQLKTLRLNHNLITSLPHTIGLLSSLKTLDVTGNALASLPSEIYQLSKLERIVLSFNRIQSLPVGISGLSGLEHLMLDYNDLEELPPDLGELSKLEIFDLEANRLVHLPDNIANLDKLLFLNLASNDFRELPDSIGSMSRLSTLDVSGNNLYVLPSSLSSIKKLSTLRVDNNKLSEFPHSVIGMGLSNLSLSGNNLRSIPPALGSMRMLRELNIGNNEIELLPTELGQLRGLERGSQSNGGLTISGNPLPVPYAALTSAGQPAATYNILAFLRGELDISSLTNAGEAENNSSDSEEPPPPPLPEAGPSFQVIGGRIELVAGLETSENYDHEVQASLQRRLLKQLEKLRTETAKVGNQHPSLANAVEEYADLVKQPLERLDVVDLWAVGNALLAHANSFENYSADRSLTDPLEPSHLALLIDVSRLHGGFILGFPKGIELTERSDRARLPPETIKVIHPPTSRVLTALSTDRELVSDDARRLAQVLEAALIKAGWETARVGHTAYVAVRNVLIEVGKAIIWVNDKSQGIAGAAVIAASGINADTLAPLIRFMMVHSSDVASFAAPFPELRSWFQWIVDHLDQEKER
jgi:Leucine-rich repeat (LRR) protein